MAKRSPKAKLVYCAGWLEVRCPNMVPHQMLPSYSKLITWWKPESGYNFALRPGIELKCPCGTVYRIPNHREAIRHLRSRQRTHDCELSEVNPRLLEEDA